MWRVTKKKLMYVSSVPFIHVTVFKHTYRLNWVFLFAKFCLKSKNISLSSKQLDLKFIITFSHLPDLFAVLVLVLEIFWVLQMVLLSCTNSLSNGQCHTIVAVNEMHRTDTFNTIEYHREWPSYKLKWPKNRILQHRSKLFSVYVWDFQIISRNR